MTEKPMGVTFKTTFEVFSCRTKNLIISYVTASPQQIIHAYMQNHLLRSEYLKKSSGINV